MLSHRKLNRPIQINPESSGRRPRHPIRFLLSVLMLVASGTLVIGVALAAARLAPPGDGQLAVREWQTGCLLSPRSGASPLQPFSVDGITLADLILEAGAPQDACVDYVIPPRTTLILLRVRWEDSPIQAAVRVGPGPDRVLPDAAVDVLSCSTPSSQAATSYERPWQGFTLLSALSACPQRATVTP